MRRRNTNIAATLGRGANGWVQRQVGYEHGGLGCPVLYGGSSGGISGGSVASAGAVAASLPASLDAGHRDLHRHRATRHADTPFHSAPTDQKRGDRYQNLDTLLYHLPPVFLKRPLKTHQDCVCMGRRTEHQVVRFVRAGERVGGQLGGWADKRVGGWTGGRANEWAGRRADGRTNGRGWLASAPPLNPHAFHNVRACVGHRSAPPPLEYAWATGHASPLVGHGSRPPAYPCRSTCSTCSTYTAK